MADDPETTNGQNTLDGLFRYEDPIFARKELLHIGHIPNQERIVGRDEEIQRIADMLNPAILGQSPNNVLLFGKTGTGKSLCANHVVQRAKQAAAQQGTTIGTTYVDCSQTTTEFQSVYTIVNDLNDEIETGITTPETGLGTDRYYNRLWEAIDHLYDAVIIILDEIDKLPDDEILMQLSRAEEANKVDNCKIGIASISNKINYTDRMDERVKSSLQERELVFQPYDATQLKNIMENRKDAFKDDVLKEDVIPLCAALAAQEHGDARKAIDILRHAGEIAIERNSQCVVTEYVYEAQEQAEIDRFRELIDGTPPQAKAGLFALARLTADSDISPITTKHLYEMYEHVCRIIDLSAVSERRVYDLMKEQSFLGVLEMNRKSGGESRGLHTEYHLIEDSEIVIEVIKEDSKYDDIE